jgi:hypothetical protein
MKRKPFKLTVPKRGKQQKTSFKPNWNEIVKILAAACIIAGMVAGLIYLEKYVKKTAPISAKVTNFELVNLPSWVNEQLKEKVFTAAKMSGEDLKLDENAAILVQQHVKTEISWLEDVKVQITNESIRIDGKWRKPLAMIKSGEHEFYVDDKLVVLDFVEVSELPIVKIKGLSVPKKLPLPGNIWQQDDVAAAVAILNQLNRMDKLTTADKPLLCEIDSIDVKNFNGRHNSRLPHIALYAKDNTEIIWGAEIDTWQRYMEATDEEKLAKLYAYYKENGSLLNGVKYINLRDPQNKVSQPVDKY